MLGGDHKMKGDNRNPFKDYKNPSADEMAEKILKKMKEEGLLRKKR